MKTCFWFLLTLSLSLAGCAPGYYATGPAYQAPSSSEGYRGMSFNNPETQEEKTMRILQEGMGR